MPVRYYNNGDQIESFLTHQSSCERCQRFDEKRTATLVHLCPHGAQLKKWELQDAAAPAIAAERREEEKKAVAEGWIKKKATRAMLAHVTKYK